MSEVAIPYRSFGLIPTNLDRPWAPSRLTGTWTPDTEAPPLRPAGAAKSFFDADGSPADWSFASVPSWARTVSGMLTEVSELPDNYDGYGSCAPSRVVMAQAWHVYAILVQQYIRPHRVVGTSDGSVVFGLYSGGRWAELECVGADGILASTQAARGEDLNMWDVEPDDYHITEALLKLVQFIGQ